MSTLAIMACSAIVSFVIVYVTLRTSFAAAAYTSRQLPDDYAARKARSLERAERLGGPDLREKTRLAIERMELERMERWR